MLWFSPLTGGSTLMTGAAYRGDFHTPLPSFRTDDWDFPESADAEVSLVGSAEGKAREEEAAERLEYRRTEEAKRAVEVLERVQSLGQNQ